jgi:hypothetical protein
MVRGRVSSDGSYVYIDPDKLAAYVRQGGGPIMAELSRRATNVQTGARQQVGKKTRRLERSIVKRQGVDGRGPFVLVVSEGVPYGYWHHEGNSRGWPGNPFLTGNLHLARR